MKKILLILLLIFSTDFYCQVSLPTLPIREDFNSNTDYLLFLEDHHTMVMHGLGLFDVESIKKEYESLPTNVKEHAKTLILNRKNLEKYGKAIGHKKFIESII